MKKRLITLRVNGEEHEIAVEPRRLLVEAIRDDLGLTGTKRGCESGVCGCCTVRVGGDTVRACLMFAVQADGLEVTTIEGLAENGTLHPLQEAFWTHHGLQCGFCTPGMIFCALELLKENPDPSDREIRAGISGTICRCTGYHHIVRAVKDAARRMAGGEDSR
ncbi:MAG: (2Fe-2S)-binding protein [Nitrospinota bacterium]|nr:(2Fe-2S)-binding protein [Nitrospinota bacterium]